MSDRFTKVKWSSFKEFIVANALEANVKYVIVGGDYVIRAKDDFFMLESLVDAKHLFTLPTPTPPQVGSNSEDWEQNFLPLANNKLGNQSYTQDDRLRVQSAISNSVLERIPSYGELLRYDDIDAINGIARNTPVLDSAFTTIYSYTGSGLLVGFLTTLEKLDDGWQIDLIIDSVNHIFGLNGINTKDMDKSSIYNYNVSDITENSGLGFDMQKDTVRWESPQSTPIKFNSKVEIKVKRVTGQGTKKFKAGLVTLYKEV